MSTVYFMHSHFSVTHTLSSMQTLLEYGKILTIFKFVLLEGKLSTRVWWKCSVVGSGVLCVMILLVKLKLTLSAGNWVTTVQTDMIISLCELYHYSSVKMIHVAFRVHLLAVLIS